MQNSSKVGFHYEPAGISLSASRSTVTISWISPSISFCTHLEKNVCHTSVRVSTIKRGRRELFGLWGTLHLFSAANRQSASPGNAQASASPCSSPLGEACSRALLMDCCIRTIFVFWRSMHVWIKSGNTCLWTDTHLWRSPGRLRAWCSCAVSKQISAASPLPFWEHDTFPTQQHTHSI